MLYLHRVMLNATERKELESLCRLTEADYRLRGQMRQRTGALCQALSNLPDHFSATFVDLHVHHTSRVDIGGQVDLCELRLENRRENAPSD